MNNSKPIFVIYFAGNENTPLKKAKFNFKTPTVHQRAAMVNIDTNVIGATNMDDNSPTFIDDEITMGSTQEYQMAPSSSTPPTTDVELRSSNIENVPPVPGFNDSNDVMCLTQGTEAARTTGDESFYGFMKRQQELQLVTFKMMNDYQTNKKN